MAYAGDLSPQEAFRWLKEHPEAALVDVRTQAEWAYVGLPDLSALGRSVITVEWVGFPGGVRNPDFLAQLAGAGVGPQTPVAFLCRSGVRSKGAAELATAHGYGEAYNITGGFEGDLNPEGHRGEVSGWKNSNLPWRQS